LQGKLNLARLAIHETGQGVFSSLALQLDSAVRRRNNHGTSSKGCPRTTNSTFTNDSSVVTSLPKSLVLSVVASIATIAVIPDASLGAQEVDSAPDEVTPEGKALIALNEAIYAKYDAYYVEAEKITNPDEQTKYYEDNDPAAEFVPKLLEFESQHQGTDVGLNGTSPYRALGRRRWNSR
jgi:hypothetical protein